MHLKNILGTDRIFYCIATSANATTINIIAQTEVIFENTASIPLAFVPIICSAPPAMEPESPALLPD
jgi:hypothetical protein